MANWWITTFGYVLCLGFVGGILIYALRGTLNSDDSKNVDPLPDSKD